MQINRLRPSSPLREVTQPRTGRVRPGFTVVELLVAVVLLSVGVLAMAATSATVLRQMNRANSNTTAARVAASRFEYLASRKCADLTDGTAITRGVAESWIVTKGDNATVTANLTVQFYGRKSAEAYRTVISCFE